MTSVQRIVAGLMFASTLLAMTAAVPAEPDNGAETAGEAGPKPTYRASLRLERPAVLAGREVWGVFAVVNLTDKPLRLTVPGIEPADAAEAPAGLPLSHVFSGADFTALTVDDERGLSFGETVAVRPKTAPQALSIAPHGSVGLRVELTRHYRSLTRPGKYHLTWRPYGGAVVSKAAEIEIMAEKQAVMVTDVGSITMRFLYDEAPEHVRNFVDLINDDFYDNLTFHRIVPGGIIQGGDPKGDGRGIRPDGKRLEAEFSDIRFRMGTVGMARAEKDPNSASCQFFICLSRQPSFDGRQTAFAQVVGDESFETLRLIGMTPTGPRYRPIKPVYIRAISLENVPPRERQSQTGGPTSRPARWSQRPDGRRLEPIPSLRTPRVTDDRVVVPSTRPAAASLP